MGRSAGLLSGEAKKMRNILIISLVILCAVSGVFNELAGSVGLSNLGDIIAAGFVSAFITPAIASRLG